MVIIAFFGSMSPWPRVFGSKGNGGWILKALGFKAGEMAWMLDEMFGMFGMVVTGPVN